MDEPKSNSCTLSCTISRYSILSRLKFDPIFNNKNPWPVGNSSF